MAVTYTNDIKPKFRAGDIGCMGSRRVPIKLNDADWMCDPGASFGFADHGNARRVYDRLADHSMPRDGAWPKDWIDTYKQWIDGGFVR